MTRKPEYHDCGLGYKGMIIEVKRNGKKIRFCSLCGEEMK